MPLHINPHDLNSPLIFFNDQKEDVWTLEDAVCGTVIFGTTGSGKSSGSGRNIARSFLQSGMGGLVLTAKADERANWVQYARDYGREKDVIVFSETNPFRFNFLDYEMNRKGRGGGQTRNIVNLFMSVYEMGSGNSKGAARSEDQFWQAALKRLLTRLIDLMKIAGESLTIDNMYQVIASALHHPDQWQDDNFVNSSYCIACLEKAHNNDGESPEYHLVDQYWSRDFCTLDEKTRSIIKESLLGLFEPFMTGILRELFMTESNISPEITHEGIILIVDLPVQQYLELGVYAQTIMKYVWQQAIERRNIIEKPTPNFLWMDEAQLFINEYDMLFQTTARSSKTCTVLLSQNISNFYSVMDGAHPKEQTDSLLGNLNTKIFHANSDSVTNNWAADLIGREFQLISSFQTQMKEDGSSAGAGYQLHYLVQPLHFTTLRTGGARNVFTVEAIITVAGRTWSNGKNHLRLSFDQRV